MPRSAEERRQVERVDAAVDLLDLSLGRRGVPLLDDARDPVVHADDPAVPVRALDGGGQDRGA
jgi:hypothetical protein